MNPNYLTRAELADFGRNTATQIANGKVSGLLAAQIASISTAIDAAAAELAEADNRQVELRAAAIEATRIAADKRNRLLRLLQDLKYTMKGLESGAHEFDAVGFDPPVIGRRPVIPQTPFRACRYRLFEWGKRSQIHRQQRPRPSYIYYRGQNSRFTWLCDRRHIKVSEIQTHRRQTRRSDPIPCPGPGRSRRGINLLERGRGLSGMTACGHLLPAPPPDK